MGLPQGRCLPVFRTVRSCRWPSTEARNQWQPNLDAPVNIASFVAGQLALFAWREGERLSPGCPEVKLGIAHVIANRVSAGWEGGGDWLKILANAPVHSANNVS